MLDTQNPQEGVSPNDAILVEMRGLREVVDARFSAFAREQDNQREWMGRMSTTIERWSETISRQVHIETRVSHTEGDVSDMKLDVAAQAADLAIVKEQRTKFNMLMAGLASFVGAAGTLIGQKVLGIG